MSRSAEVPEAARRYFENHPSGPVRVTSRSDHPIISMQFHPKSGWKRSPIRKRVSTSWLRRLGEGGYEAVTLRCSSVEADFSISELLSRKT